MSRQDFVALFDQWAASYDATVHSRDGEYAEVFEGYERILDIVAGAIDREPGARVIDVGTGTGNLARRALALGYEVVGVEPSPEMRKRAGTIPGLTVQDGDFLRLPVEDGAAAAIVSSYAFHHLTDVEKYAAARTFARVLDVRGRVVFADTCYRDADARASIHDRARNAGYANLLRDLESEYYTTHAVLRGAFEAAGFAVAFTQLNRYVWLIEADLRTRAPS